MKPKIIECPKCESKFDVSTFEPGEKFECANCKNIVFVPSEVADTQKPTAAPRRKLPEGWGKQQPTGPVSVPGAKSKAPISPRRGGGVPKPAPTGRRATGVPKPAPTGRRAGRVPEPRPSVPGRAKPVGKATSRAADARRAAAMEKVAAREERPGRRRSRTEDGAATGSNMPLLLGAGGLLVAVIVVIAIAMSGSGGDDGGEDVTIVGGGGAPTDVKPKVDPDDPSTWSDARRRQYWATNLRLKPIGLPKAKAVRVWRDNHAWAERYGMLDLAKEALTGLLKVDSQDEWANKKAGNKLFEYAHKYEDGMAVEDLPWDRKAEIAEFVDENGVDGKVWVTAARHRKLTELQSLETEHLDKIKTDPKYRWTKHWIQNTRLVYTDFDFKVNEDFAPYLVFVQDPGDPAAQKEVDRIVRRNGLIFQKLHQSWVEMIQPEIRKVSGYSDFELPKLGEVTGNDYHTLKIWVFYTEKDFHDYHRKIRDFIPPGARAYYKRDNQWITLYEGRGGESIWYDKQNFNIGKVFHEGTHQIIHYYTKLLKDRRLAEMGEEPSSFEDVSWRSFWFTEGVPELFGGADEIETDRKWEVFRPNHNRVEEFRQALALEEKVHFTLNEMIDIKHGGDLQQVARTKSLNPRIQQALGSLFYAQAWTFCHFLWFGENGKYRPYFVRYLIKELEGKSGPRYAKEVFKDLAPNGDFTELEKKMLAYLATMPVVRGQRR